MVERPNPVIQNNMDAIIKVALSSICTSDLHIIHGAVPFAKDGIVLGESGNADIGISLPGRGESPVAPVYCDGVKKASLKGDDIMNEFKAMIDAYVAERWGSAS